MKRKLKVCIGTALAAIMSIGICANIKGNAENVDVIAFSGEITAVTPYGGETVSVVHNGMESVLNMSAPTAGEMAKYYQVTPEMRTFLATGVLPATQEEIRACLDKCDDFAPIGNVLEWQYTKAADSYTINVALDKKFTKVVYSDTVEGNAVCLGNTLY